MCWFLSNFAQKSGQEGDHFRNSQANTAQDLLHHSTNKYSIIKCQLSDKKNFSSLSSREHKTTLSIKFSFRQISSLQEKNNHKKVEKKLNQLKTLIFHPKKRSIYKIRWIFYSSHLPLVFVPTIFPLLSGNQIPWPN